MLLCFLHMDIDANHFGHDAAKLAFQHKQSKLVHKINHSASDIENRILQKTIVIMSTMCTTSTYSLNDQKLYTCPVVVFIKMHIYTYIYAEHHTFAHA